MNFSLTLKPKKLGKSKIFCYNNPIAKKPSPNAWPLKFESKVKIKKIPKCFRSIITNLFSIEKTCEQKIKTLLSNSPFF